MLISLVILSLTIIINTVRCGFYFAIDLPTESPRAGVIFFVNVKKPLNYLGER
jgi:hypothetical protein